MTEPASARAPRSPLDAPPPANERAPLLAASGAVLLHAGLVLLVVSAGASVARGVAPEAITELFEVALPKAPEPPPKPAPAEPEVPRPRAATVTPEPPAPAAAEAGRVLAAEPDVVDFGDTLVSGSGASYAGGVTERGGTSRQAVRDAGAHAGGNPSAPGTSAPAVDRSRPPRLAGGARWDCPFPEEAEDAGVDHAVVSLRVEVAPDGRVVRATVTRDPGDGFGREARRCALQKTWEPGLDRDGKPAASIALVNVRFDP